MGKGRNKRRRNKKLTQRAAEAENAEFWRRIRERSASREPSDPPVFGEPDAPVRSPLKPRPSLRSSAIAMPEPEPEEGFALLKPRQA